MVCPRRIKGADKVKPTWVVQQHGLIRPSETGKMKSDEKDATPHKESTHNHTDDGHELTIDSLPSIKALNLKLIPGRHHQGMGRVKHHSSGMSCVRSTHFFW